MSTSSSVLAELPLRTTHPAPWQTPLQVRLEYETVRHIATTMFSTVHAIKVLSWSSTQRQVSQINGHSNVGKSMALKRTMVEKGMTILEEPELPVHSLLLHPGIAELQASWFVDDTDNPERIAHLHLLTAPVLPMTVADLSLPLPLEHTLSYVRQLCEAFAYMHHPTRLFAHRDVKLPNVLVDPAAKEWGPGGRVMLCDFGSPGRIEPGGEYILQWGEPATRAPEPLLGSGRYTCNVDMFSLGVLMMHMITGEAPMKHYDKAKDQLAEHKRVLGEPTREELDDMQLPDVSAIAPMPDGPTVEKVVNSLALTADASDLLKGLLCYRPTKRLSAKAALRHPALRPITTPLAKLLEQEIVVRTATAADCTSGARCHILCWREAYTGLIPQETLDNLSSDLQQRVGVWQTSIASPENVNLVAVRGEELVGFAMAVQTSNLEASQDISSVRVWYLERLYIMGVHHGKGLGRRLLDGTIKATKAREEKGASVVLEVSVLENNAPSIAFYEQMGFKPTGKREFLSMFQGWQIYYRLDVVTTVD